VRERRELDYRSVSARRFDRTGYHRRPAASDGTGCASERTNDGETGRSHHERAMSGQSVDMVWDPQTQTNSLEGWDYSIEFAYLNSLKGSTSESSK
jgi:hypothetical protein